MRLSNAETLLLCFTVQLLAFCLTLIVYPPTIQW